MSIDSIHLMIPGANIDKAVAANRRKSLNSAARNKTPLQASTAVVSPQCAIIRGHKNGAIQAKSRSSSNHISCDGHPERGARCAV